MKILVIRRDNIGDLVCTTPMLAALRQHYPEARIVALVNDYNADVVRGLPGLDHVYAYTKLKHRGEGSALGVVWRKLRLYWQLRREKFDLAIVAGSGYAANAVRLAKAARARRVVAFVNEGKPYDPVIDTPVVFEPEYWRQHEVLNMALLLQPLGIGEAPGRLRLPDLPCPPELAALQQGKPLVALHISAREASRVWPLEHFQALATQLLEGGCRVLFLWSPGKADDPRHPGDDDKAAHLRQLFAANPDAVFYPTQSLQQLIAAYQLATVAVCSDGGGLHIAAAAGARIAGLYEHLEKKTLRWYPWQVPYRLLTSGSDTHWQIAHIPLAAVSEAVFALLAEPETAD